jgi:hypothetical protein
LSEKQYNIAIKSNTMQDRIQEAIQYIKVRIGQGNSLKQAIEAERENYDEAIYKKVIEQIKEDIKLTKDNRTIEEITSSAEKEGRRKKKNRKIGTPYLIRNYYRIYRWKHGLKNSKPSDIWHIASVADFQIGKTAKNYAHRVANALGYKLIPRKNCTHTQERTLPKLKIHGLAYRLIKITS